jgi:hypothetical protein
MANDPGLSPDTCIFLEAETGDGGAHNASHVWWLSPDIELIGPVSGIDNADAGQINPVTVRFHRKPDTSNCVFPGDESLVTELWVANPSLVIAPHISQSSARAGLIGSPLPGAGDTATQEIDFTPSAAPTLTDPHSPGSKCLVARVFPSSLSPSASKFFLPGDEHVVQHNLCTVRTSTNAFSFTVNTCGTTLIQSPLPLQPKPNARLRAVLDLRPINFVKNTVLSRLNSFPGFQQLTTVPLKGGFKFDLTHVKASNIVDHSHPPLLPPFPPGADPSYQADVVLDGRHITSIPFLVNLTSLPQNVACIFHLIQLNILNVVEGGLTLVILKR